MYLVLEKLIKILFQFFKFGLINVHRGIINKYRGLDSDLWAIYHKDLDNIGVTIHKVDENLDTGKRNRSKKIKNYKKKIKIYQLKFYNKL